MRELRVGKRRKNTIETDTHRLMQRLTTSTQRIINARLHAPEIVSFFVCLHLLLHTPATFVLSISSHSAFLVDFGHVFPAFDRSLACKVRSLDT